MCFFLTIAVPEKHCDRIGEAFGRGFQTFPYVNPTVASELPEGYVARLVTSGMCSCDLYVRPGGQVDADPADHLRRKYQKRGWSEVKISRAVKQAEAARSKLPRPTSGIRPDVVERLQVICQSAGRVALFVHWYNGGVDTEHVSLTRRLSCHCDEFPQRARELGEDILLLASTRRGD
jgi:hypothetical protein